MPTIRIDDEVYGFLEKRVEGFETPNDVLKRLLGLKGTTNTLPEPTVTGGRRGEKTPPREYRIPILEALEELGGGGRVEEVLERVLQKIRQKLTKFDIEELPSGADVRWRNTAQWERYRMAREGLLRNDSPRGIWEISQKGVAYLERNSTRRAPGH